MKVCMCGTCLIANTDQQAKLCHTFDPDCIGFIYQIYTPALMHEQCMTCHIRHMDDPYNIYTMFHIDYTFRTCHLLRKQYAYCINHMYSQQYVCI